MTDIEVYRPTLIEQMEFARSVVVEPEPGKGGRTLLPDSYRNNPANVLIAVGLGSSMGLSPAESLYRIDVIQGKPTAGAELIAANVRKAGHKLRVQGDETTCTATIVRADDPDFPFTVTRDIAWATRMGLTSKDNYKKQPGTMLQWRAITAVARLACPEALYGVAYTADELGDGMRVEQPAARASGGLAEALRAEQIPTPSGDSEDSPAETPGAGGEAGSSPAGTSSESPLLNTSSALAKRMFATLNDAGVTEKDDRLEFCTSTIGRPITSSSEMTEAEAQQVIDALVDLVEGPFAEAGAES